MPADFMGKAGIMLKSLGKMAFSKSLALLSQD
jgi:hypothetical protein